jgi:hypothetical protein
MDRGRFDNSKNPQGRLRGRIDLMTERSRPWITERSRPRMADGSRPWKTALPTDGSRPWKTALPMEGVARAKSVGYMQSSVKRHRDAE